MYSQSTIRFFWMKTFVMRTSTFGFNFKFNLHLCACDEGLLLCYWYAHYLLLEMKIVWLNEFFLFNMPLIFNSMPVIFISPQSFYFPIKRVPFCTFAINSITHQAKVSNKALEITTSFYCFDIFYFGSLA